MAGKKQRKRSSAGLTVIRILIVLIFLAATVITVNRLAEYNQKKREIERMQEAIEEPDNLKMAIPG